jgi:glucokinase
MLGLVGDIGGTNSRFALASEGTVLQDSQQSFRNADFNSFPEVLRAYLGGHSDQVNQACLGCAGTVRTGFVNLVNWPWRIFERDISAMTGASRVFLMNDLQAQGYALHRLSPEDLRQIAGPVSAPGSGATRLIVSIGTGVNAAVAYETDGRVFVPPAESGFWPLPVEVPEDLRLLSALRERTEIVRIETALSGDGLVRLWEYFGGSSDKNGAEVIAEYRKKTLSRRRRWRVLQRFWRDTVPYSLCRICPGEA